MDIPRRNAFERAGIGQRKKSRILEGQLARYKKAFYVGRVITSEMDRDLLFQVIIHQTNEILEAERSTVFLYEEKTDQLWSLVATGAKKREIRIPADYGVAGWVFQHRTPVTVNDAYGDPRFYSDVDKKLGFKTRNILCIPLINWSGNCIGALQSLNKTSGEFTDDDRELLLTISHYVSIALENMRLYEELKDLSKARERTINHLSHELKTPLALIASVFDLFSKDFAEGDNTKQINRIKRGRRNVNRLVEVQDKIDDILNLKSFEEGEKISRIIEAAAGFVEECSEENHVQCDEALALISKRIESVYGLEEIRGKNIELFELLSEICDEAVSSMRGRDLQIIRNLGEGLVINADKGSLKKVFVGLLKNAIENTPDEGRIEVNAGVEGDEICIYFRDYGVGISPQNQKLIFGGFFHTQDTMDYASKKPYQFNAGGSGCDLLRTKVFSERHGFSLDFESTRCKFIPNDIDNCPGRISECQFVTRETACFSSGGTVFSARFRVSK